MKQKCANNDNHTKKINKNILRNMIIKKSY